MSSYETIVNKWKSRKIADVATLHNALLNFRIMFAYYSGAIENSEITYHNTREIFENGKVISFTGNLRTLYEIQNQKECFDFLEEKVIQKQPITGELVKEIHLKLTQGTYNETRFRKGERPGTFKVHDYCVADGQGALPEDVPEKIGELCEEIADISDCEDNILKTAAYIHCKFENIHPFADGNGRVGRMLMNYFLMINDYPPLLIRNDTKERYFKALGIYDKTGDVSDFMEYMKEALEATWKIRREPKKMLSELLEEPEL